MKYLIIFAFLPVVAAFDYFLFSQTWAPTFCKINPQKCSQSPIQNFIIHGLWPQFNNNTYPEFCEPCKKFDKDLLEKKMGQELKKYWSDTGIIDWDFLEHEWEKHGCCSGYQMEEYFSNVLDLRKEWEYKRVFESIGIYPNTTIVLEKMRTAAMDFCGNKCYIAFECLHNKLIAMYMSLSKNMSEIMKKIPDSCGEEFIW